MDRDSDDAPHSPGRLPSHYAPALPVRLNAVAVRRDEALLAFGPESAFGAAEVLFLSPDLFNNVWMNQIVAGGVEVKMWGDSVKGIEVGQGGPMEVAITFVPVRPGEYAFTLDGVTGVGGTFIVR